MPRPTRAQGRPGTQVIPTDWNTSHAPVVARTWTGTCHIHSPAGQGTPVTINTNLTVTPGDAASPLHSNIACRIQILNAQESRAVLGDQEQATVTYLVVVDRALDVPHRAVVEVTTCDDGTLVGRRLTVRKINRGTQVWERDLYAVEDQTAPNPT